MSKLPVTPIRAGDNTRMTIRIRYEDLSNPDLTDCRVRWWMAPSVNAADEEVLIRKDTELDPDNCALTQVSGVWYLVVNLLPDETKDLRPKTYYHEASIADALGNPRTVKCGPLTVEPTLINRLI